MRNAPVALVVIAASSSLACQSPSEGAGRAPAAAAAPLPTAEGPSPAEPAPQARPAQPGVVPFDFPVTATTANRGDFVLAPPRSWIDEGFAKGGESQTFIYYGGWMKEPGPTESLIRTLPGHDSRIPNSMILVVGRGHRAKSGDVVLTAWASGAGMQRAIVVEGGTPDRPRVRYLDIDFDHPSGWGQKDDELPEGTFRVLSEPGGPGTTVACREGARRTRWIVTAASGEKLLGLGSSGRMRALARADCANLPSSPNAKTGDEVFVPVQGVFTEAKVVGVHGAVGRLSAKYDLGGGLKEEVFSFANVAAKL